MNSASYVRVKAAFTVVGPKSETFELGLDWIVGIVGYDGEGTVRIGWLQPTEFSQYAVWLEFDIKLSLLQANTVPL